MRETAPIASKSTLRLWGLGGVGVFWLLVGLGTRCGAREDPEPYPPWVAEGPGTL